MNWLNNFDDRQKAEIKFSILYEKEFNHGTDGHNAKLIIAKMAVLLDEIELRSKGLANEVLSDKLLSEKETISLSHRLMELFK